MFCLIKDLEIRKLHTASD